MHTFKDSVAQGDLLILRIESIPAGLQPMPIKNGAYIVAHSETGHHHVIDKTPAVKVYMSDDPLVSYMRVIEATEETEAVILRHMRSFDTHAPISIPPGNYELRRQREYTPEGWRRVAD